MSPPHTHTHTQTHRLCIGGCSKVKRSQPGNYTARGSGFQSGTRPRVHMLAPCQHACKSRHDKGVTHAHTDTQTQTQTHTHTHTHTHPRTHACTRAHATHARTSRTNETNARTHVHTPVPMFSHTVWTTLWATIWGHVLGYVMDMYERLRCNNGFLGQFQNNTNHLACEGSLKFCLARVAAS